MFPPLPSNAIMSILGDCKIWENCYSVFVIVYIYLSGVFLTGVNSFWVDVNVNQILCLQF